MLERWMTMAGLAVAAALLGTSAGAQPRTLTEMDLWLRGVSAHVADLAPVAPKAIASSMRIVVKAGAQDLTADEVRTFLGGDFQVQGELSGPGLAGTLSLPDASAGTPAVNLLALPLPALPTAGDYDLTNLRVVVGGRTVLDVLPGRLRVKVIDQILVTQVTTRPLTLEEIQARGIVLDRDDYLAFEFDMGLLLDSQTVNFTFPVVFDREGVAVPLPLSPPPIPPREGLLLPQVRPVLMNIVPDADGPTGGGPRPELRLPNGEPVRIPGLLVIPGDVGYLKQFFAAKLFVANGAPRGTALVVRDVSAKIKLPLGNQADNSDAPLALPDIVRHGQVITQPLEMPVRGVGSDGEPNTSDDADMFAAGEQGQAEFLLRGEREGFHRIDFDIKATLDGLPGPDGVVAPLAIQGAASGGVLVRNPYFDMTFTVPTVVRAGEIFPVYVTVTNIGQGAAQDFTLNLDGAALGGMQLVDVPGNEPLRRVARLAPRDAVTFTFTMLSQRNGAVIAKYLKLDGPAAHGSQGQLKFTLGVGERGVALSPDTLTLPTAVDALPADVVQAALRVLGQAWSVAKAPSGSLPVGVRRITEQTVVSKALALAEAGLRVTLGEPPADALRDLAFDVYRPHRSGTTIDFGFDQLLRETEAGHAFAQALGLHLAGAAAGGPLVYEHALAEVGASGEDFLSFAITTGSTRLADVSLTDALDRSTSWAADATAPTSAVPHAVLLPLGSSLLGFLGAPQSAYVLELVGRDTGHADVSITLPAGDGVTFRRAVIGLDLRAGSRTFLALDPQQPNRIRVTEDLDGDGAADGPSRDVSTSTLLSQGPRLLAAAVIGPETLDGASEFGVNAAVLFDRVVDATTAGDATHYGLDGNALRHARRQLSGRLVFTQLQAPEGPYERQTLTVSGVADTRGQAGATATVDLTSRLQTPGGVVTGRVLEADGTPVQGARIIYVNTPEAAERCMEPPDVNSVGDDRRGIAETQTDAQGQYALRYVKQNARGCPFYVVTRDPHGAQRFGSARVRGAGDRQVLDIVLFGRGGVTGTVRNRVSGAPVAGAAVTATSTSDAQSGGRAVTDTLGRYTIAGLTVGPIAVQAAKGIGTGYASGRIFRAGETATVDVLLDDGAVDVAGRVAKLEGGVSTPAAGALVVVSYGAVPVGWQYADADGRYRLRGMPTGAFEVRAQYDGLEARRTGQAYAGQSVSGHDLVLHVANVVGHDVRGHVTTAAGAPAAGVWVFLSEISLPAALTDASGAFTLRAVPVPDTPRAYTVYARTADGRRDGSAPVQVLTSGPTPTDVGVRLSGLGAAEFTVVGPDGRPQAGVQVGLRGSCANPCGCASATSNSVGRARFENLPVGPVRVQAFTYVRPSGAQAAYVDWAEAEALVTGDGETGFGVLRFNGVGSVRVLVRDDAGAAVGGSEVSLRTQQFDAQSCRLQPVTLPIVRTSLTSATPGEVRFSGVLVGTYDVSATNPFATGAAVGARGVLAQHGEEDVVTLTVSDVMAGELSGTVLLPDGTPAGAGVSVTVSGPLPALSVETDSLGAYHFRRVLPAGRYLLEARDGEVSRGLGVAQETLLLPPVRNTTFDVRLKGRGSVRVLVVDGAGQAVTRGTVTLREGSFPSGMQQRSLEQAVSGALTFPGVYEGPFSVEVKDAFGRGGRASGTMPAANASVDVTLRVSPTGCVRGRFVMPDGVTAIPYGTVKLLAGASGAVIGQATTANDGGFAFDFVPLGAVRLEAQDPLTGRNGLAAGALEVEGVEPQCLGLDVRAEGLGTVTGRVLDNGTPREAVEVEVVSGRYRVKTFSAAGGAFRVEGVPAGQVVLTARPPSAALAGSASGVLAGEGDTLTLDVALRDSVTVAGRVVRADGVSAAPPSEVRVSSALIPSWNPLRAFTDTEGRYRVERVPVGVNTLDADVFDSLDRGRVVRDVARPESGEVEIDLTLNGVGRLVGHARDASDQPVAGSVTITGAGAFPFEHYLLVGADGRFELPQALAGPVTLRLQARPGGVTLFGTTTATVTADAETSVTVRLQDCGSARGRVLRADGLTPAYGADVIFERAAPYYRFTVQTNAQGDFVARGVPLGPVSARVVDRVTGGVVFLPPRSLDTNGAEIDYGTVTLDDAAPRPAFIAPSGGTVSAGFVVPVEIDLGEDVAGLDLLAFRVTYTNGSFEPASAVTFNGTRATGVLQAAWLREGANHVTVRVVDRAGHAGEATVDIAIVGASVEVRVLAANGAAALNVPVTLDGARTLVTDASGRVIFTGVRAGLHTLLATDPASGRTRLGSAEVVDGGAVSVTLTLPGAQRLEGVLRGRDGRPVGGQVALVSTDGATEFDRQFTDGEGHFVLSAPSGTFRLRGFAAGDAGYESQVEMTVVVAPEGGTVFADALANTGAIESSGQRDGWRFGANTGETVRLRVRRHPTGIDTPDGPQIEVRRLDGTLVAAAGVEVTFTASETGWYVAVVRGPEAGASPGGYRLVSLAGPRVFVPLDGARLSGRVVRQGSLTPVVGQRVRVRLGIDERATVATGADGRYAVDVFPAGAYTVEALEGSIASAALDVAVPAVCVVAVPDLVVPARGSVRVHVTRAGVGEAGIVVALSSDHPTALEADRTRTADTHADGYAEPVSLPVGTITARAVDPRSGAAVETLVALAADATLDVELVFAEAPRAQLHGTITARDGVTPLAGAAVELVDRSTNAVVATATTDAAGRYAFADVPQGTYILGATFGVEVSAALVELLVPDVVQDLMLDVRILRGVAREDDGAPIAGAGVRACGFVYLPATTETCVETRTNITGAYVIYGLPHWFVQASGPRPGAVNVSTENGSVPWLAATATFIYDDATTFTTTLDLVAPPAGTLAGHVRDGASDVPNADVRVYDTSANLLTSLTADSVGAFSLRLPVGDWRLWATDADGIPGELWTTITAQQTTNAEIVLTPSGALNGTRLDEAGAPAAGVVRLDALAAPRLQSDVPWSARVLTDAAAQFTRRVPAGPWRALVGGDDCPAGPIGATEGVLAAGATVTTSPRLGTHVCHDFTAVSDFAASSVLDTLSWTPVETYPLAAEITSGERGTRSLRIVAPPGIEVRTETYTPASGGFRRTVTWLANTGTTSATVQVETQRELAPGWSWELTATSSGDLELDDADAYAVAHRASGEDVAFVWGGALPLVNWQFNAESALAGPVLRALQGSGVMVAHAVEVPPGETRAILAFTLTGPNGDPTLPARAAALLSLAAPEALDDLSAADRAAIVNFTVPASLVRR